MCLITGCLRSTQTVWLPVLANIAPPDLCHKADSDKLMTHIAAHKNWPVHAEVFQPPTKRLVSRHPIWTNPAPIDIIGTVERSRGVGFCGQSGLSSRPYYPTIGF